MRQRFYTTNSTTIAAIKMLQRWDLQGAMAQKRDRSGGAVVLITLVAALGDFTKPVIQPTYQHHTAAGIEFADLCM